MHFIILELKFLHRSNLESFEIPSLGNPGDTRTFIIVNFTVNSVRYEEHFYDPFLRLMKSDIVTRNFGEKSFVSRQ